MSKATKRKHVTREVLEGDVKLTEGQSIVKVVCGRGNNLHEVESSDGNNFLVSMPTKFRRNVWIKRGDYVVIERISEGQKVQAEIVNILYQEQIKELKRQNLWPEQFLDHQSASGTGGVAMGVAEDKVPSLQNEVEEIDSEESDSDIFVNTNRPAQYANMQESDSCSSDSD